MKYAELQKRITELERDVQLLRLVIQNAHDELDLLGAPNAECGAHPGHRVLWYRQQKDKGEPVV